MPRTKISKSKRNREVSQREEKIREYETLVDELIMSLDILGSESIQAVGVQMNYLKRRITNKLMEMRMPEFLELNLAKFTDTIPSIAAQNSSNASVSSSVCGTNSYLRSKTSNPNDEGYLTEDSATGRSGGVCTVAALGGMAQLQQQRGRTPGPLSSAKARRPRRSKSFCADYVPGSIQKVPSSTQSIGHTSRGKMRTPLVSRTKAFSADRTSTVCSPSSPPTAFMRWPRPGELVMSVSGSPVVAQVMPDKFANVNIPMRNGVLSLRPKKLSELKPEFLEAIDQDTLNQIKTLHANLNLIMNMADKVASD